MIINYGQKIVQTKIVYYGPAMSGKTTSLKSLFGFMDQDCEMKSIETTTGRTLFFDFGMLSFKGLEWDIKIYLYSTTGQDFYKSTRPATLFGVDGIIFVVDSQKELLEYNINSWKELHRFFPEIIKKIPIIIALNKSDLDNIVDDVIIKEQFELQDHNNVDIIPSIATSGKGVKEAFLMVMNRMFPNFNLNV